MALTLFQLVHNILKWSWRNPDRTVMGPASDMKFMRSISYSNTHLFAHFETHGNMKTTHIVCFHMIQWTPSNPATLGSRQSVLIRGVASFHGWICTRKILEDILKWPEYRGGLISGVQIRGSSLYNMGVLNSHCILPCDSLLDIT